MTVRFEPDVTVIIGENNSGKTNILDALYASLRVNRTVRQGAFELHDYHLPNRTAVAGAAGPIELTVSFREGASGDWEADILGALNDVLAFDPVTDSNSVALRVTSKAPELDKEEEYDWVFLDAARAPIPRNSFATLHRLQTLRPFFGLNALRDATREFSPRSMFFSPFITDPSFDSTLRQELITSLSAINAKVMEAHTAFSVLGTNIADGNALVGGDRDGVTIEAVPARLSELLENTQVSLSDRDGAMLPLDRHGSGGQSLAVLSLFKAYVHAKLASRMDKLSRAILTIEEPENHLHPSAARSLWDVLSTIEAQVIVTSHSGDLLGEVPLRCVRRVRHTAGGARIYQPDIAAFGENELRQLNYAIRATRGELLFANAWLLVEGRSESMSLPELARSVGRDLTAEGIRVVEYAQAGGPAPFIKLADQLGIGWHCLCDGDVPGLQHLDVVRGHLHGRSEPEQVTSLETNLEGLFCKVGFLPIYDALVPIQKRAEITAPVGTDEHSLQVAKALPSKRKEQAALEVCSKIASDRTLAPQQILGLFERCRNQAQS